MEISHELTSSRSHAIPVPPTLSLPIVRGSTTSYLVNHAPSPVLVIK